MAIANAVANEYLGVMVGDTPVGIATEFVQEVFETTLITRLPGSPEFFLGMVNVRGYIIPVLDIISIADSNVSTKKIVILNTKEGLVGLLISKLIDLMKFTVVENTSKVPQQLEPWEGFFTSHAAGVEEKFYIMDVVNCINATLPQTLRKASV